MKFKIEILDGRGRVIGYWRLFSTGEVELFSSRSLAERTMAAWAICGRIVSA